MSMICDMTDRRIRPTTASDFEAVDGLLRRSYPALLKADYAPSVLVGAIPVISRARPDLVACGTYFVVEQSETAVAAGGWTPHGPRGGVVPELGHIRHVVTDHRHTRQGHAAALMAHIFRTAKQAGMTRLECWSTLTAEPFYASQGFARLSDMALRLGPGQIQFPAVRMMADISWVN